MTDWTVFDVEQQCCDWEMKPIDHEAQIMADAVKRTYLCNRCQKRKIIQIDMYDMSWAVRE